MDTTAAAELGMGMLGAGVDGLSYAESPAQDEEEEGEGEQAFGSPKDVDSSENRGHARPLVPETSQKKMKMMPAGAQAYFAGGYFSGGELPSSTVAPGASAEEMWYANPWQGVAAAVSSGMNMSMSMNMNMNVSMAVDSSVSSYAPPGFGAPPVSEAGRGRGTGSIFYKTKLCSKFKVGACPFESRCNFAHGVEELRKPPQGWENLAAPQEPSSVAMQAGRGARGPVDVQKFKTRPCKFFKETSSCPYGDRCTFLHDQSSGVVENTCTSWSSGDGGAPSRPPNYKTKICNQWEASGNCTFGDKCHFAHGPAELQRPGNSASYPKVSDAVIYDCGISWNPSEQSRQPGEQDAQQQQQQQQQQMPEGSTGLAAYGSYAYQQIPYFRPQMYGYGQYTTTTPQNGGFFNNTGNHDDSNSQAQHGGQQESSYDWSEEDS